MALATEPGLAAKLADYLGSRFGDPVDVVDLVRIWGGASRETYRFKAVPRAGQGAPRPLILRLDPAASLIDTDRRSEFEALRAFRGSGVPVPEVLWLEPDEGVLGGPFMVMAEITGGEAAGPRLMEPPYAAHREAIGQQKWTILGRIAAADPAALGLTSVLQPVLPEQCWRRELDHWEALLEADALEPQPVQRAAIRWMRRNPPPPAQRISVVHGDYRTGNLLVSPQGELLGVLDWEMVHLGDPLEDLAWSFNRVWCFTRDERRGGLLHREDAIALWERASGLKADPAALRWWELLNCLKGQAIWLSAARNFQEGANGGAMMAFAAWMCCNSQDRATLELLGRLETSGARA
jgi:aminoglycoside phosphotransferase (APT) family kinase protein